MQTQRKRGRPPLADRRKISLAALRLFERHGYDKVTMNQVAKAAAVSRTTLFRLFPSKADLVWDGLDAVLQPVKARAARLARKKASLRTIVDELILDAMRHLDDPDAAEIARRRLCLVGTSLDLLSYPPFAEMQTVLAETVAAGLSSRAGPPSLIADMLVASAFASVLWWARQDALSASEALRAGLAALKTAA